MAASAGCSSHLSLANPNTPPAAASADALLDSAAERMLALHTSYNPAAAYFLGVPAPDHRRWPDRSQAAIADFYRQTEQLLRGVRAIEGHQLTSSHRRLVLSAMKERLHSDLSTRVCRFDLWDVDHLSGWHVGLADVASEQPVVTVAERSQALQRWASLPTLIDQEIENARLGLRLGYSAPKSVVRRVIGQVESILASNPEGSPLFDPAGRTEDAQFRTAFRDLLSGPVQEGFARYLQFLRSEYLPRARDGLSILNNPDGRQCYEASLRSYTTVATSPEEVFRAGRETVSANIARVQDLGRARFGTDDLPTIVSRIADTPDNRFSSEAELIDFSRRAVVRGREQSRSLFGSLPSQELRVEAFETMQRGSGASSFYEAQADPNKPAFYRINSEKWPTETRGSAEITAFHEAYPGHHLQIGTAQAIGTSPIMNLLGNSAYAEGWGRYAEALAEEAGMYETDYALMTRRLWPARGMVVDPGLHLMGWSRDEIVSFISASGRFTGKAAEDLVDRIAMWPGQMASYDVGALEFLALRREAENALGERFDIREFHRVVLKGGPVPLQALRETVRAWIATKVAER